MVISTVGYEKRTGSASSASIIIQKELQPDNAIIQGKAISSVGRNVLMSVPLFTSADFHIPSNRAYS
ncbi:hypothetical protein PSZ80_24170, partial [Shigella sonnei]|nr:hypothetical protein [Shigella sonnei]